MGNFVNPGGAQSDDGIFADAAFAGVFQNPRRVDGAHAAVVVRHHADFFGAQLIHRHQQAAHHRAPWVGDQRAGILDQLGIAVFQAHGLRQQLDQPGVHARQHGQVYVGEFIGFEFFVFTVTDKLAVMREQIAQQAH